MKSVAIGGRGAVVQPFFTTKPAGEGTGLGLPSAMTSSYGGTIEVDTMPGEYTEFRDLSSAAFRKLAQMMGGDITVASEPNKGSLFTVRFPGGGG